MGSKSQSDDVSFKATATRAAAGNVNATLEMVYGLANKLKLTETWDSNNDLNTKVEFSKITNLKLTGECLLKTKTLDQKVTLAATYATPSLHFNAKVDPLQASIASDVVFKATESIFVGLKADTNAGGLASDPMAALLYKRADFSIFASSNGKKMAADAIHKVNDKTAAAFNVNFNLEKSSVDVGLGVEHKTNGSTYKVKALSKGAVGVSFKHPVKDGVNVTLAAELNAKSMQIDAHKVGLSLEFL